MSNPKRFWIVLIGAVLALVIIACSCGNLNPLISSTPVPPTSPAVNPIQPTIPTSRDSKLPYYDNFSDPTSGWDVYDYDNESAGYGDGFYYIISRTDQYTSSSRAGKSYRDTVINVDVTAISGPNDNNYFISEVGCRNQTNYDGYAFAISTDGYYSAGYYTGGGATYVSLLTGDESQASNAIKKGLTTNHLSLTCSGSHIKLEINGTTVYEGDDTTFTEGDLDLGAETMDAKTPAEVHFTNLAVTAP